MVLRSMACAWSNAADTGGFRLVSVSPRIMAEGLSIGSFLAIRLAELLFDAPPRCVETRRAMERVVRVARDRVHHARRQKIPSASFRQARNGRRAAGQWAEARSPGRSKLAIVRASVGGSDFFPAADDRHDTLRVELGQNIFARRRY